MTLMRAARLHLPTHTLTIEEVPRPTAGPGQVFIEVAAAGVSMSDVHLIDGTLGRPPHLQGDTVIVGHEGLRHDRGTRSRRHPVHPRPAGGPAGG